MTKSLIELVEEYGRTQMACGVLHMPGGEMKSGELLSELRTKLEALDRDAARYRWLRDEDSQVCGVLDKVVGELPSGSPIFEYPYGDELDSRIDAAMEAANVPER